jgi:hypothetical protein
MDKARARTLVLVATRDASIPPDALEVAVDLCYPGFDWARENSADFVRECQKFAAGFVIYASQKQSQSDTAPSQRMPLPPADPVMSKDVAEKIRPAVEQLRSELFDSPAPPFPKYEDAVQWLEQTALEQNAYAQANSQTRIALEQSIHEKLEEYRVLTGEGYQSPFLLNLLEYAKLGSDWWVHRVHVWGGTSLATLAHTSKRLGDATGFTQASVVAYILAGIPPFLASVSINILDGYSNEFHILRRSATVTMRSPYVTDAQLREMRKVIRSAWRTEKKKPLTESDKQLLDIIQRQGAVPQDKGKGQYKAFYELVRQQFNPWADAHGYKTHRTWKGTRLKHKRLLEKLQEGSAKLG